MWSCVYYARAGYKCRSDTYFQSLCVGCVNRSQANTDTDLLVGAQVIKDTFNLTS